VVPLRFMSGTKQVPRTPEPPPERPLPVKFKGELRRRVLAYSKAKGRSAANAVFFMCGEHMRKEGF
jgi:hypothetical protein